MVQWICEQYVGNLSHFWEKVPGLIPCGFFAADLSWVAANFSVLGFGSEWRKAFCPNLLFGNNRVERDKSPMKQYEAEISQIGLRLLHLKMTTC